MEIYQPLEETLLRLKQQGLTGERRQVIQPLIDYVTKKLKSGQVPRLNFICTHNSRRSQMAQAWAYLAAHYYGIEANTYSGGVEVTAFHANAIKALAGQGFDIRIVAKNEVNPTCFVRIGETVQPLTAFSKLFDHANNPKEGFAAVMTCSDADENCPFIPGTEERIPLLYEDPKAFDDTPTQEAMYLERAEQIGRELLLVFQQVKANLAS